MLTRAHRQDNICTDFRISKISVPELPSEISSPEETFHNSLRRVYISIDELHLEPTKSQERLQTLSNYTFAYNQIFDLQMQPQAVSGSDISLSKVTSQKIFVSSNLDPDIDPIQGID